MAKKDKQDKKYKTRPELEAVEPRLLFSGGLEGVVAASQLESQPDNYSQPVIEQTIDQNATESAETTAADVRTELIFVDTDTPEYRSLLSDLLKYPDDTTTYQVFELDNTRDGIAQITAALSGYDDVSAIHILSHGNDGEIDLGGSLLNADTLAANAELVGSWGSAFTDSADILIYGCNLAATADGQLLVNSLATLTGADVAASDDLTGSAQLGGDWELEYRAVGTEQRIESESLFAEEWVGLLADNTTLVSSNVDSGWNGSQQSLAFYNGENYFLVYADGTSNIRYKVSADNVTWSGEQTLVSDYLAVFGAFDINIVDDNTLDIVYTSSADNYVHVKTGTTSGQTITVDAGSVVVTESWFGVSVTRAPSSDRIFVSGRIGGAELRVYSADQTGDAGGVTSWTGEVTTGVGNVTGSTSLTAYGGADKVLVIYQVNPGGANSDGIYSRAISYNGGAGTSLEIGNLNATGNLSEAVRVSDTEFHYVLDSTGTAPQEYIWNDTSWSLSSAVGTATVDDAALIYDRTSDDFYMVAHDTATDDIIRYHKASGGSWDAGTLADGNESGAHSVPIAPTVVSPYASARNSEQVVWAYRVENGSNYDLYVGNYDLNPSSNVAPVFSNLDGTPAYTEGGAVVVLDSDVTIYDAELSTADNFDGATLTLQRNGGANGDDAFSATGTLGALTEGGSLVVGGTTIGAVTTNSNGTLVLSFNGSATNALVNQAMQQIAYSNASEGPQASVQVDWSFDDGDAGGAKQANGSTTVTISLVNTTPTNAVPGAQSTAQDTALVFSTGNGNVITVDDPDAGANTVEITLAATNGTLTLNGSGGLVTVGNEITTNTDITYVQTNPTVAMDAAGGYVAVWQSTAQDTDQEGIFAQRYDADGIAVGSAWRVNTEVANDQSYPAIAMDAAGNFVITWQSEAQDQASSWGIYAQRYSADGTALGSEFLVNTSSKANHQNYPDIAMDSSGNFVIVWQGDGAGDSNGVFGQRFNNLGVAQGGEFLINTYITDTQWQASVDMNASGEFVVAWSSQIPSSSSWEVNAQIFNVDGSVNGSEFKVSDAITGSQNRATVVMKDNGEFVIGWVSGDINARVFDASGTALTGDFAVNTTTTGAQTKFDLALTDDEGFIATWGSPGQNISMQKFDWSGTAIGAETQVNSTVSSTRVEPTIASNANGDYVVLWRNDFQVPDNGIYAQHYVNPGLVFSSGDGADDSTMTLTGTLADINIALDGLTYTPNSGYNGVDTLTITTNDQGNTGTGGALQDVDTVDITVGNANAPVIDLDADDSSGQTAADFASSWTEGSGAVAVVDTDATLIDADENLSSLAVTITNLLDGTSESLTADTTGTGLIANYDAGTGVLTISGVGTAAEYQQVLRTVTYNNTSENPTTTSRVITFTPSDASSDGNTATTTLTINATNDAPTGSVTISGTAMKDQTLTASNTLADADGLGVISYQWQRDGSDIAGATASTYTLTDADVGATITVVASYTDLQGTNESVASAGVGPIANVNNAPVDLQATATTDGGISLNADGGNDVYFVADDGAGLLGGLTTVTIEASFSITTPGADLSPLLSYADGAYDEELALFLKSDGRIWFGASSNGSPIASTTGFYPQLFDGEKHQVSVSWDASNGAVDFYIDGQFMESITGYQTGQTITGTGELVFGQDQDSVLGGFKTIDVFSGELYDVRIFNDVRTAGEIADSYDLTLPNTEPGMIANWMFNDFSTGGVITDSVSGNNLTEQHVVGAGFSTSTPSLSFSITENSANGTTIGSVVAIDPDAGDSFAYTLVDDAGGRFAIDGSTGQITLADTSLLDFTTDPTHTVTVRVTDNGGLTYDEAFTITIIEGNRAPTVIGESFDAVEGVPYAAQLGVDDLLLNDSDPDGDTLTVNTTPVSGPANGALILNADGTFTYTPNNNFNGVDSFVYEVSDGNGGTAQATATFNVATREIRILLSTQSDVNSSRVPGVSDWDAGEILAIGDPNLSFEPAGSDGSLLPYMDLEAFSASGNMTINGLHFVSNNITVGGANSINLVRGDILFVADSNDVMTSTNNLAINAGDVIVFRPDVADDYSSGTFIHLLDQPGTAKTTGITLIESNVLVGDVTLQAGTFLFTQESLVADSGIYHFSATDVGAGTTTGTVNTLINSADLGLSWNNFVGVMIVSEDLYLDGTMVPAGSIVTSLLYGAWMNGDYSTAYTEHEIIYLTATSTTMGSGTTVATPTVLFDAGEIGLNNNQKKIRSFTIIEEIHSSSNVDPVITLNNNSITWTEADPPILIDPTAVLTDPDSSDFDGGLLRIDLGATGKSNDLLSINDEGTDPGQIGITSNNVTYGGVVIGSYSGGNNGSTPLTIIFNANADVTAIQALLRNLTYYNVSSAPSETQRQIDITITDGDGGTSNTSTVTVVVNDLNSAPVLTGANDMIAINEDLLNSGGTLVSILTSGWITDSDASSIEGIAVTGVDNSNGDWQFSIDGGANWTSMGTPSINNAWLLAADTDTYVRFAPDADWYGTVSNGITFRAWDQSTGVNGDAVDMALAGNLRDQFDATSYSNDDGSASWTSDWIEINDSGSNSPNNGNIQIDSGAVQLDSSGGGSGEAITRSFDLAAATTAVLTFDYDGNGAGSLDNVAFEISNDGGSTWIALESMNVVGSVTGSRSYNLESFTTLTADMQLRFRLATGFADTGDYIRIDNVDIAFTGTGSGGSSSVSLASASSSITVNPVNDEPVGLPTITGTPAEDQTLTVSTAGVSDAEGLGAFSYQWQRNGSDISGATGTTYVLGDADVGSTITVTASYTDGQGTGESVTSAGVGPVANVNHVPVGVPTITGTATEDQILTADTSGISDDDGLGAFSYQWLRNGSAIAGANNSTYTLGDADVGTQISVAVSYNDGEGTPEGPLTSLQTAAVLNVNDQPTVSNVAIAATEDGVTVTGSFVATDIDTTDTHTFDIIGGPSEGSVANNNDGTFTFDPGADFQDLALGETRDVTFTYTATDDSGAGNATSASATVTVTLTGTDDAPTITGDAVGAVTEDAATPDLTDTGTLVITDADNGEAVFQTSGITASSGALGNLSITTAGVWTYTVANANVQYLAEGATKVETFTVLSADGTSHDIVVTLTGTDDAPTITGDAVGAVTEDAATPDLTDTGTLVITDADNGEAVFQTSGITASSGALGNLSITTAGVWTYTVANANVQYLAEGATKVETFTVLSADGTSHDIVVTLTGTDDAPTITGDAVGAVTEDAATPDLTDTGTLVITDADNGEAVFQTSGITASSGALGNLSITTAGVWTYTVANANVQYLAEGATKVETFTVLSADGTSHDIVVTLTGTDDAPTITGDAVGAVTEDAATPDLTDTGTLVITDADNGEAVFQTSGITASSGALGNLSITTAGVWTYTVANANVQYLAEGATKVETFTVLSADGTSHDIVVTLTGTDDAPTITGDAVGAVTEDAATPDLTDTGTLVITDADNGEAVFQTSGITASSGALGNLSITTAGVWTYTVANANVQYLAEGATKVETFTVLSADGTSHDIVVTLTGTDDAPTITGDAVGAVTEDAATPDLTDTGTLVITDADNGEAVFQTSGITASSGALGNLSITTAGVWTYTVANANVQYLAEGATKVETFTVLSADGTSHDIVVTLTGTDDAPTITGDAVGAVTEDAATPDLTDTGTLVITDADNGEAVFQTSGITASSGALGNLSITTAGVWTYTVANANVQYLAEGATKVETFTVLSADGTSHDIVVTLTGTDDAPTITGDAVGAVTEDAATPDLTDTGTLVITDADNGEAVFQTSGITASSGALGNLSITTAGVWTYTVANANVQYLAEGATKVETFTVLSADGTSHDIVVTLTGTDDAPTITGDAVGAVTEDAATPDLTDTGTLVITDADNGEAVFQTSGITASSGALGNLSITTAGVWTYTVANANVQYLAEGATKVETFTVLSADGTSHDIVVTLTGTDDAPTITGDAVGAVTEDAATPDLTDTGTLVITDADNGEAVFQTSGITASSGALGNLSITTAGVWTYTVANANVQYLAEGATKVETFTVLSADGTSHDIVVTLTGTDDAPTITGDAVGAVTEDAATPDLTDTGTLVITDADNGEAVFQTSGITASSGALGNLSITTAGVWTYTVANANVQYLAEGATKVETFTVLSADGTSHDIVVTLTGTDDAPTITGDAVGAVTEDAATPDLTDTGTLVITDADNGEAVFQTSGITASSGALGNLSITTAGVWTYTVANANVQYLAEGATKVETFTVLSADGTSHDIVVTLTGTDDAPTITGDAVGAVTEDAATPDLTDTGTLVITDADNGEAVFQTSGITASSGALGNLSITTAGVWTYTVANANVQYLAEGATKVETFTVLSADGTSHDIVVTLTGTDDAPTITGDAVGAVTEDAATPDLTDTGTLVITDADNGEAVFQTSGITASSGALGNLSITTAGVWTYTVANANVQYLAEGATKVETFTVLSADGTSHDIVVTLTGTDDAPTITGDAVGAVTEDAATPDLTDTGTLVITDADNGEAVFQTSGITASSGALGNLSITTAGVWTYTVANANVQYLAEGATKVETFTVLSADGTSHDIVVTLTGTDDAPTITGDAVGAVTEDAATPDLTDTGTLVITDADNGEAVFQTSGITASSGALGNLSITTAGVWTYTVANANVQYLAEGATKVETFTVLSADGTSHDIVVTLTGTNDTPTVSDVAINATEDGAAVTGSFVVNDIDTANTADTHTFAITGTPSEGSVTNNGDGSFSFDPGSDFQDLALGDTRDATFSYTATDDSGAGNATSTAATVTVTVTGTNDTPVGVPIITGNVQENETLTADTSGISDSEGLGVFSYQWLRDGSPVSGAINNTYALDNADVGSLISVHVSYIDGGGTVESVTSAPTAPVANVNNSPVGEVTIDNTMPVEGDTLTASNTLADADGISGSISYQWYRDGVAIAGATASTYTTVQADLDAMITVTATYTDDQGSIESVSSAATAAVSFIGTSDESNEDLDEKPPEAPVQALQVSVDNTGAASKEPGNVMPGEVYVDPNITEKQDGYQINHYDYQDYDQELYQDEPHTAEFLKYTANAIIQTGTEITEELLQLFDLVRIKANEIDEQPNEAFIKTAGNISLSLSVGVVAWIMRGGSVAISMLSSMSVLKGLDPMPVMNGRQKLKKDVLPDDNNDDALVDGLFDGSGEKTKPANMEAGKKVQS